MNKQYHLMEIPELSEESQAFLLYIINQKLPKVPFEALYFTKVNVPFGAGTIDYVMYFKADKTDKYQVFSLVSSKLNEGDNQGVVWRLFDEGELEDYSFTQFKLRPISHEGVAKLIIEMPTFVIPMEADHFQL